MKCHGFETLDVKLHEQQPMIVKFSDTTRYRWHDGAAAVA